MLRWFYFSLASASLVWGVSGWAGHYLIAFRSQSLISISIGAIAGFAAAALLRERNALKPVLFLLWPLCTAAAFFSMKGSFDFADYSFTELLNFEVVFIWGTFLWALLVLWPRSGKLPRGGGRFRKRIWQQPLSESAPVHSFRLAPEPEEESAEQGQAAEPTGPEDGGAAPAGIGDTFSQPISIEDAMRRDGTSERWD